MSNPTETTKQQTNKIDYLEFQRALDQASKALRDYDSDTPVEKITDENELSVRKMVEETKKEVDLINGTFENNEVSYGVKDDKAKFVYTPAKRQGTITRLTAYRTASCASETPVEKTPFVIKIDLEGDRDLAIAPCKIQPFIGSYFVGVITRTVRGSDTK